MYECDVSDTCLQTTTCSQVWGVPAELQCVTISVNNSLIIIEVK